MLKVGHKNPLTIEWIFYQMYLIVYTVYSNLPAGAGPLVSKLFPGNTPLSGVQPSGKLE